MIEIRTIDCQKEKENICFDILTSLPKWFAIESAIIEYSQAVRTLPFFVAFTQEKTVGFLALLEHNKSTAEIYVMGVLPTYHRSGVGKKLVEQSETYCSGNRLDFLTVKTLAETSENASYEKTRHFYSAMGFKPLEVFPFLWNEKNPCLLMAKALK